VESRRRLRLPTGPRAMNLLIGTLIDGIILSGVYALAALGFVIIYRATRVFNFAQGEFMMLGAYFVYLFSSTYELPLEAAVLLSLLGVAVIGIGIFVLLVRPLTGQPLLSVIVVTMGVAILIRAVVGVIWGPVPLFIARPFGGQFIDIGAFSISMFDVVSVAVCGLTYAAVIAFLNLSSIGLKMRATAENPTLASERGVNLNLIFALSWGLAALAAAVAGAVFAGRSAVSISIVNLGLSAFPAALVGGFDSVGGTLIGALVVGLAETIAIVLWGAESKDVVAAAILLTVLAVRPYGLFGTPQVNRL
jgi:branched-chain amino acid transport system permease protein